MINTFAAYSLTLRNKVRCVALQIESIKKMFKNSISIRVCLDRGESLNQDIEPGDNWQ